MRKDKFVIVVCIFVIGFILVSNMFTGFVSLHVGENSEVEGNIVEVANIGPNFVKIKIGDEKTFIKSFGEKELKGVKIKVNKIFYVDEVDGRFVELELESSYVCGNGVCDGTENKASCCKDCGCDSGSNCIDDRCKRPEDIDECWQASDCDDGNSETVDLCMGIPKKCYNKIVIECEINLDCDDGNSATSDECVNNECFNDKIKKPVDVKDVEEVKEEKPIIIKKEKSFLSKLLEKLFGWI